MNGTCYLTIDMRIAFFFIYVKTLAFTNIYGRTKFQLIETFEKLEIVNISMWKRLFPQLQKLSKVP